MSTFIVKPKNGNFGMLDSLESFIYSDPDLKGNLKNLKPHMYKDSKDKFVYADVAFTKLSKKLNSSEFIFEPI